MKMAELRGSRSYGSVLIRKPRRSCLVEILCRAWTGAFIDWGSAELLPDRSLLTVSDKIAYRPFNAIKFLVPSAKSMEFNEGKKKNAYLIEKVCKRRQSFNYLIVVVD